MILVVRVVVDGDLLVSLTLEKLRNNIETLFQVALAVGGWVVCARKPGLELVGVRDIVSPAARPSSCSGEVACSRVPVETKRPRQSIAVQVDRRITHTLR